MTWKEIKDIIPKDRKKLTRESSQEFVDYIEKRLKKNSVMRYFRNLDKNETGPKLKFSLERISEMGVGVGISFRDPGGLPRRIYLPYEDQPEYVFLQNGLYVANRKKGFEWVFILN